MVRNLIINFIVFAGMSEFLICIGHSYTTWEFWVIIGGMFITLLNNGVR